MWSATALEDLALVWYAQATLAQCADPSVTIDTVIGARCISDTGWIRPAERVDQQDDKRLNPKSLMVCRVMICVGLYEQQNCHTLSRIQVATRAAHPSQILVVAVLLRGLRIFSVFSALR